MYFTEGLTTRNGFPLELPSKFLTTNGLEESVHPPVREDVHEVHTTCVRYVDWRDLPKEQRSKERRNERYASRILVRCGMRTSDLVRDSYNQQREDHGQKTLTLLICGPVNLS